MLAGDKQSLAIGLHVEQVVEGWVDGQFAFWINGACVSNLEDYAALHACANWLRDFVERHVDRRDSRLWGMSKEDAYDVLDQAFVRRRPGGRDLSLDPPISDTEIFGRFYISHLGMTAFDRVQMYLIEHEKEGQRCLWETDGPVHEAYFPPGEMQRVAALLLEKWDAAFPNGVGPASVARK